MSGLFKNKKQTSEVSVAADPYKEVRESLNTWLQSNIGKSGPDYSGERVAPMTGQEQQSLDYLDQYANRSTPATTEAARKMATDTLAGNYDPTKSPVYQAVKAESARNLTETQKGIKSDAAGGGRYWTGARLNEQQEAATSNALNLNTILAQATEAERDRQLGMVPVAGALGEQESQEDLQTSAALQQYGQLPRVLQQALDDASYQEFLTSQYDYPLNIAQIAGGVQQAPTYSQVGYAPSIFSKIMEGLQPKNSLSSILGN